MTWTWTWTWTELTAHLRASVPIVVAGALLAGAPAPAQQPTGQQPTQQQPTAAEILTKVGRQDLGGRETVKIESLVDRGTCTFTLTNQAVGGPRGGTFDQYLDASGKAYAITDFEGFGTFEEGTDGRIAWQIDPMSGTRILVGAEEAQYLRHNAMARKEPWQDHYERATRVGIESIDGRDQFVIEMTPKLGKTETWFVDKELFRITRVRMTMVVPPTGEEEVSITLADHRRVDGVLHPFRRSVEFGFVRLELRSDEVAFGKGVPESRYDLPDAVMDEVARLAKQALAQDLGTEKGSASPVSIINFGPRNTAVVRVRCAPTQIGAHMSKIIPEVIGYLQGIGVTPASVPFSRFYEFGATVDFEAGFPVVEPVPGNARVRPGELPGGRVATLVHVGPYDELARSYGVLEKWFEDQGHEVGAARWEEYLTDPAAEPDPQKWRSRILWTIQ